MAQQKEPTLEEVLAQLKALTGTVEKLIEAKKPAPAPAAAEPVMAKLPKLQDVQPAAKDQSHIFTIPKGSAKDAFNFATPIEAVAVQNYLLEKPNYADLVDIPTTLAALAMETVSVNNRKALYPVQLEDFISARVTDPTERAAIDIVEGRSRIGFGIVAIKAQHEDGYAATLYVVEDQLRQKLLVVGPDAISPELDKKLNEHGLNYTIQGKRETPGIINEFLAEGARLRGEEGLLLHGKTQLIIESLIRACSAICEFKEGSYETDPAKGSTVGQILNHSVGSNPAVFTSILKGSARPPGIK